MTYVLIIPKFFTILEINKKLLKALGAKYIIAKADRLIKEPTLDIENKKINFKIKNSQFSVSIQDYHAGALREICVQKYLSMISQGYTLFNYKDGWICKNPEGEETYQMLEGACTCGDYSFRGANPGFIGCKHILMKKGFEFLHKEANEERVNFLMNN